MKTDLIPRIKQRGYWRINFRPLVYDQKLKSLTDCAELVIKNKVSFRGWSFPHYTGRQDEDAGIENTDKYVQSWTDSRFYKEYWQMHQSGQFLDMRSLKEDWLEHDSWMPK